METTKKHLVETQQPLALTGENAHRVLSIHPKDATENFPEAVQFHFRGKKLGMNTYQHLVGNIKNGVVLSEKDFQAWLVVEVKHPGYLEEYWQLAQNAYRLTSFEPEERGETAILTYEAELHQDLQGIPEAERERYIDNYKKYFSSMLSSHTNCASTMITGPAGFNHKRNEKAHKSYDNRHDEFRTWRNRALAAIARRTESTKTVEQKQEEEWTQLLEIISHSASTIHSINIGKCEGYTKALFVNSIRYRVATYARNGEVEIVDRAIAYIREQNGKGKKPIITEQNCFFKLPALARAQKAKLEELAVKENKVIPFDGGKIVLNYQEDRLQICLDAMPSDELRYALKRKYSFNWSPKNKAWQRRLTDNSLSAAKAVLNLPNS